ncbi:helix-turn-helix transcriptional regulator [Caproiciproducens galactitolivorans]|uniref:Helix-turn-helix protein n=1 Tax=Caproiciproducens galactitolivorans TaxID=642589 RepID=A0A4Z0YAZ8_9FIRM|nr:helix-turn-helix transcriptional regulator [Caproiciproducens galactitolivorans]QEY33900.1 helix-turn-helix transcriptional regulator [Caproiciproducens galactitolivorans]TGJ76140.1 helix-turn-helix protein [Caproiciproducens galactitolivorans]
MVKILLKKVRWEKNWTVTKVSVMSGVSHSMISDIENEKAVPTINVLCAIARGLQVPVTDLFIDTNGIQGSTKTNVDQI